MSSGTLWTAAQLCLGQPEAEKSITRTLFIGLAMIESLAIYVFVIVLIILFRNATQTTFVASMMPASIARAVRQVSVMDCAREKRAPVTALLLVIAYLPRLMRASRQSPASEPG